MHVPQVASLPHISECNRCFKCSSEDSCRAGSGSTSRPLQYSPSQTQGRGRSMLNMVHWMGMPGGLDQTFSDTPLKPAQRDDPFMDMFPQPTDISAKARLPNCSECCGCSTQLQPLQNMQAFGQDFKLDAGASPEWIFTTSKHRAWSGPARPLCCVPLLLGNLLNSRPYPTAGDRSRSQRSYGPIRILAADLPKDKGQAVIKVWCFPIDKARKTFAWRCKKSDLAFRANKFLVAQDQLIRSCGLQDVTVRVSTGAGTKGDHCNT